MPLMACGHRWGLAGTRPSSVSLTITIEKTGLRGIQNTYQDLIEETIKDAIEPINNITLVSTACTRKRETTYFLSSRILMDNR